MAGRPRSRRLRRWVSAAFGIAFLLVAAGAALRANDGPLGMLPGGAFRGEDEACLEGSWEAFAAIEELEVEVAPTRPRSVTTWSVVHAGMLYLPADFLTPMKRWPHQVMQDDRVRLRIGGRVFRCRALRVADRATIAVLGSTAAAKYRLSPDGFAARSEVWWFRVVAR